MQALFTLTSSESKRLLGKAVAALPEVQHAKEHGYLVISAAVRRTPSSSKSS